MKQIVAASVALTAVLFAGSQASAEITRTQPVRSSFPFTKPSTLSSPRTLPN